MSEAGLGGAGISPGKGGLGPPFLILGKSTINTTTIIIGYEHIYVLPLFLRNR
jgi:hypothetical protein